MHFYPHHIGDFIKATARLNDAQCMSYLRLLWVYYDTEKPLPNDPDSLAFEIGAEPKNVALILKHFFTLEADDFWHHSRCDLELAKYKGKSEKAAASAQKRWENPKNTDANASKENANASKTNAKSMRTHTERNANEPVFDANQEPRTKNQELRHKQDPRTSTTVQIVTTAGVVCKKIKELGISNPNPHDQALSDLLTAGHALEDFVSAAIVTLDAAPKNPWKYLLAVVSGAKKPAKPSVHTGLDSKEYGRGVQKL